MRRWIIPAVVMVISTACQNLTTPATAQTPVIVEVTVEAPITPSATPDCEHADGVTLTINRLSNTSATPNINGLKPGEKPYIIYSTSSRSSSTMGEMHDFAEGADQRGGFSIDLPGLKPLEGQTSATWDIRVIHARGVECATITLP